MPSHSIPLTYLHGRRFFEEENAVCDFLHEPRPLHSFALIESGNAEFFCEGECITVNEGEVIYVPKGCRYRSVWHGVPQTVFYSCHFDTVPFGEPIGKRVFKLQKLENCRNTRDLFLEIAREESDPVSSLHAVGSFLHLLSKLFPCMRYESDLTLNDRIIDAVRYIEVHYDMPLRVSELASLCHVSPSYFYECFKKEMGTSPIEYKNKITIGHAQRILSDTKDISIEELSERLGFESAIYFRRLFKAITGKTPSEYRKTAVRPL